MHRDLEAGNCQEHGGGGQGEGLAWWGVNWTRREKTRLGGDRDGVWEPTGWGASPVFQRQDVIRTQAGSLGVRVDRRCRDKRGGGPSAQDVQVSCSERPQARASRGGHTERIPEGGGGDSA